MEILIRKNSLSILILSLFLISCSDKDKEIFNPIVDNLIEFSLSNRVYKIEDIVKRQSQIQIDSGKFLLRFSTGEIRKDTTLDAFNADFFNMNIDTTLYNFFGQVITADIIVRRDSVEIQEAELESGIINFSFTNYTTKQSVFQLILPGFTRNTGSTVETLKIGGTIPPLQVVNYQTDLSNFVYKQPSNQPFGTSKPGFWVKVSIGVEGGMIGDSVNLAAQIEGLRFKRIKGLFKPLSFGIKDQTFANALSRDISELIEKVTFDSIKVILRSYSTVDIPIAIKGFRILGLFNSGKPPIYLRLGDNNFIDTTIQSNIQIVMNFDNTNSNINEFLSKIPDSIKIFAEIIINPNYQTGEISAQDSISFSFKADAWSRFTINQATWTDTFDIDISQDARNKLKNGKEGSIIIYTKNEIPLETELVGLLVDSSFNPLLYITKDLTSQNDTMVFLHGAQTNSLGEVIAPSFQNINITLDQSEIEKFSRAQKLIQRFSLSTTESRVAEVSAKAKIDLKIRGKIKIELTSDDF